MRLTPLLASVLLGLAAVAFAPSAAADFPGYGSNSGDNADDFAVWCTLNLGDCAVDGSPRWFGVPFSCSGDVACYVLYCTYWNPIHQCVL